MAASFRAVARQAYDLLPALPFLRTKWSYYRSLQHREPEERLAPMIETLTDKGIVVIPGFAPPETIQAFRTAWPDPQLFVVSPEGDQSLLLREANKRTEFEWFFKHPTIYGLARAHIGEKVTLHRATIEWRRMVGPVRAFDRMYHMDTWKHRLKAFMYLDDVGPENAPMSYLQGSHKGIWRLPMEATIGRLYRTGDLSYAADEAASYLGCYWPHEVLHIKNTYGFDELSCTGSAGTLVVFDARGLHRATDLISGERRVAISYWISEGHHT